MGLVQWLILASAYWNTGGGVIPPHDFHTSLAEMNYNETSKSFEVSLRVFTDDLELALGQFTDNLSFKLSEGDKDEALIKRYIDHHFFIINTKKQKAACKYYGQETKADKTIIYFEIFVKRLSKNYSLQYSVLTEVFEDQFNIVNMFFKGKKLSHRFKRHSAPFPLVFE